MIIDYLEILTYSIPFLACSNRLMSELLVAVVRNIGPIEDSCNFK